MGRLAVTVSSLHHASSYRNRAHGARPQPVPARRQPITEFARHSSQRTSTRPWLARGLAAGGDGQGHDENLDQSQSQRQFQSQPQDDDGGWLDWSDAHADMDVDAVRQPATPPTLSELASSLVSGSSGVSSLSYDYEYDEYDSRERVFLVAAALKRAPNSKTGHQYSILESLEELGRLAETAGLEVVGYTYQMLDELNPRTYVNTGKVGEIAKAIADTGVQTVLFDDELSPGQMRNLERALGKLGVRLCDRTALIDEARISWTSSASGRGRERASCRWSWHRPITSCRG